MDHLRNDPVRLPVAVNDPGGMHNIKQTLYRVLSAESRLVATKSEIRRGVSATLDELLTIIEKRRAVIAGLRSREVAEQKLATFRREFEENGRRFSATTREDIGVLAATLANRGEQSRDQLDCSRYPAFEFCSWPGLCGDRSILS